MAAKKKHGIDPSQILAAIIGGICLILAGIIVAIVQHRLDARSLTPAPPTSSSEKLQFVSTDNPLALNPHLQWDVGSSELSVYAFDHDILNLTAGPHTWPNFPMLHYKLTVTGNFDAQVRVVFKPEASILTTAQMVGLLVRPVNARMVQSDSSFPKDWAVASRYINAAGSLVGCRGAWEAYPLDKPDMIYLRLARAADSWRCAYSNNGENWVRLNANVDDSVLKDKQLAVSLFAYSDTDNALTAKFADWVITTNP